MHQAGGDASSPAFSVKVALSGFEVAGEALMRAALESMIGWGLAAPRPLFTPMRSLAEVAALQVCFGTRGGVAGGAAIRAKWIEIRTYASLGSRLPDELAAWKAKAIQRAGSRLAEWKARLLQNSGDDSVLGRRRRLGQTQEEARVAIMQRTAAELKAEAEMASREGAMIGHLINHGKLREDACRAVVRMSKEGRIGIAISHLVRVHGETRAAAANIVAQMSNAELVRAAAAAEGLKLVTSATSRTGFKNVYRAKYGCFEAKITENGTDHFLGTFATPEEAALCYASYIGVERAAAEAKAAATAAPLTVDEAWAAAAAEGLELMTSAKSGTGFKYVYKDRDTYAVKIWDKSTRTSPTLGTFKTPGEAAIWVAKKNRGNVGLGVGTSDSAHDLAACGDADDKEGGEKKQRFVWEKEVHQRFCKVVRALGIDSAKPQKIAEELARLAPDASVLPTRSNIKSHLQQYRLLLAKQRDEGDTLGLGLDASTSDSAHD
jgi:SHAQKYF class myb-like DNA-binding protein